MNEDIYRRIVRRLRKLGFPRTTAKMVADTHVAMKQGKAGEDMPHGIIGWCTQLYLQGAIAAGLIQDTPAASAGEEGQCT